MANVVFTCGGVELREFGGEMFSTVVPDGTLTIKRDGGGVSMDVAGNAVPWVASAPSGPFKRIDTRSFMIATTDLMSSYYVTLPKGLPEAKYEHFNAVLTALKEGGPIPAAAPLSTPEPAAPAAATAAAGPADASGAAASSIAKPQQANPFGGLMSAIAQKAAHDTQMLGDMIKQKAAHDMQSMQEGQHKTA